MLSVVLFLIIVVLLFLGNDKRQPSVPTRVPYGHSDVVLRESQALRAYADFLDDLEPEDVL